MSDIYRKLLVNKPYVEIGGVKWATMNIGANSETDYGLYFQWGDTQGYTSGQCGSSGTTYAKPFAWADCVLHNGTSNTGATTFTKYNGNDGKTVLDETDDAAVANWGGKWRMPTREEFAALGDATIFINSAGTQVTGDDIIVSLSGKSGIYLQDKTDTTKRLFFPLVGYCTNGNCAVYDTRYNSYWASSLYTNGVNLGHALNIYMSSWWRVVWGGSSSRANGCPIRPVLGE